MGKDEVERLQRWVGIATNLCLHGALFSGTGLDRLSWPLNELHHRCIITVNFTELLCIAQNSTKQMLCYVIGEFNGTKQGK